MTVALKGSLTWESVLVRVSSSRMRRATSCGTVKFDVAAWVARVRRSRTVMMARGYEETKFNGDLSCFRMIGMGLSSAMWGGKSIGFEVRAACSLVVCGAG